MLRYSAILLSATAFASAGALGAQEVKPRSTPVATDRLPRPAGLSAAQQPDGRIRVLWRAVDGAVRYKLTRSVPPEGSKAVALPNPSDTQYVDTDVKPGSTYYYLVSGVNEAGIEGLRAGTTPVTAAAVVAPADTTRALPPVPPPTNVTVKMHDYLRPEVTWQTSVPGARAVIERREEVSGTVAAEATWQTAVGLVDRSWPCSATCRHVEDPRRLKGNSVSQYRVTIVEPAPSTRRSEPVTSNKVLVEVIEAAPTEIHQMWLVKGESYQLNYRPAATVLQYMSLDSNTVSIWSPGVVKAKEWGVTYVAAVGRTSDGALKLWIWQTRVGDKPQ